MSIYSILGFTKQADRVYLDLNHNKKYDKKRDLMITDKNGDEKVDREDAKLTLYELSLKKRSAQEKKAWKSVQKKIKAYQKEIAKDMDKLTYKKDIILSGEGYKLEARTYAQKALGHNPKSNDHIFMATMTDKRSCGVDQIVFDFSFTLSLADKGFWLPWSIPGKDPMVLEFNNKLDLHNIVTFFDRGEMSRESDHYNVKKKPNFKNSPKTPLRYLLAKVRQFNRKDNDQQASLIADEIEKLMDSYFISTRSIDLEDTEIFPAEVRECLKLFLDKYKNDLFGESGKKAGFEVPRYIPIDVFGKILKNQHMRTEMFICLAPLCAKPNYADYGKQTINFSRTLEALLPEMDFKTYIYYKKEFFDAVRDAIDNLPKRY